MLNFLKKIIPKKIFKASQPAYHYLLALLGATLYSFPGKKIVVVGVTGTKGKTTTTELVNAILEEAGYQTALMNTLRFKIGENSKRNLFKMSMPGRFFIQKFLSDAVKKGCDFAVLEMTSEGAKQFRHKFTYPDALIFTNLAPEHIESHGSYQKYLEAKLSIAREMESPKKNTFQKVLGSLLRAQPDIFSKYFSLGLLKNGWPAIIANSDDKEGEKFLALDIKNKIPYSLHDAVNVKADSGGSSFQVGKIVVHSQLPGIFSVYNMLGAIAFAKFAQIPEEKIKSALEKINLVRGRMEKIEAGQDFEVVVDYAHTPDSLKAVYEVYKPGAKTNKWKLICVLGNTGGGRDTWKRPEMAKIAGEYCDEIILTNEDPYDEDPRKIIADMEAGIKNKKAEIVMDRRVAIKKALKLASDLTPQPPLLDKERGQEERTSVAVLITGKGTDPYIMGRNGSKEEWDDAAVAREELQKILKN